MLQAHSIDKNSTQVSAMSEWFGDSSDGRIQLGHSFAATTERSLSAHEHVFLEGENQTHIHQVIDGVISVYKLLADGRRQIVGFHYPGDIIGLDHVGSYENHGEALCETRVRCIPVDAIDTLIMTEPGFGQAMLQLLSTELAETRDQLLSLGRKSAMEKLATFLLRISRRNARHGRDPLQLQLPMTRAEIADYLGLTVETISRNFTRLKLSAVIHLESNSAVRILDLDELESVAEAHNE
ncbi:MAG: helix-turn-helix domain-containing protein [Granulosicoccus sp.]|nr:helix-turn-helix domain-containing protein [Granulosicoccus sp.]